MSRSDSQTLRLGAITLVVLFLAMAAAFNLSKMPGFAGQSYRAEFSDASGLRKGNIVQVAGQRVGRVRDLRLDGNKVIVDFEVDSGVEFGTESRASVEVLNLLGEKYLALQPEGPGQMDGGSTIPLERTEASYDIVGVLGDLTQTTERIDTEQLGKALDTLAGTLSGSSSEIQGTLRGVSRLSRTVAARDAELKRLFESSRQVSKVLADRSEDLTELMKQGSLFFGELRARRDAISRLLVHARTMVVELEGVAQDNRAQLKPALRQLRGVLGLLQQRRRALSSVLQQAGPYVNILSNIVGTGPWFDAYVPNLGAIPSGEFVPGPRR